MSVQVVNLSIEKGADFSLSLKLKSNGAPINLTGYSFSAKMKKHYNSQTSYPFTVTALNPLTSGNVTIGMASTVTSTIPSGRYVYDVLVTNPGIGTTVPSITSKYFKGTVIVEGTSS
jgi:hypothetical protein